MKKRIAVLLAVLCLSMTLLACGENELYFYDGNDKYLTIGDKYIYDKFDTLSEDEYYSCLLARIDFENRAEVNAKSITLIYNFDIDKLGEIINYKIIINNKESNMIEFSQYESRENTYAVTIDLPTSCKTVKIETTHTNGKNSKNYKLARFFDFMAENDIVIDWQA